MQLNKSIEMQSYSFDLYFCGKDRTEEENVYLICYNEMLREYGCLVNDLIIVCGLKMRIEKGMTLNYISQFLFKELMNFTKK